MAELAIFDLDGTLVDTSPGIFDTARYTVGRLGVDPDVPMERMRKFIGPPLDECFRIVYNLDDRLIEQAYPIYQQRYRQKGQYLGNVYEGIPELLASLRSRGWTLAVGTLKEERVAKTLLAHFGLAEAFDVIHGDAPHGGRSKSDVLKLVMEETGIPASNSVLIGDTGHDQKGAMEAGVRFIPVTYGFGFPKDAVFPVPSASSPGEILPLLVSKDALGA